MSRIFHQIVLGMLLHVFCIGISISSVYAQSEDLDAILKSGISSKIYPGIAAISGSVNGKYIYSQSFGSYEYLSIDANSPTVAIDSMFDLASLSKVVATTSAIALLYQNGFLALTDLVSQHLQDSNYSQNGKENVTILNCLLHNAGYFPDPSPGYYDFPFNCPNTGDAEPALDFSCVPQVFASFNAESLASAPGAAYVYSDLSFITLQFVAGAVAYRHGLVTPAQLRPDCASFLRGEGSDSGTIYSCYFEAYVRTAVFQESEQWLSDTGYLPASEQWARCLPTTNDSYYRHTINKGKVADSNCYAMGGVCGHAGVFSTAPDMARFLTRLLRLAVEPADQPASQRSAADAAWLNASTVRLFTTEFDQSQSSRALGWTTNDPAVNDFGFTNSCGTFSARTFMHIGYTGTCLCVDPVNGLWSVVLTNRVYGVPMGSSDELKAVYRAFHSTLLEQYLAKQLR